MELVLHHEKVAEQNEAIAKHETQVVKLNSIIVGLNSKNPTKKGRALIGKCTMNDSYIELLLIRFSTIRLSHFSDLPPTEYFQNTLRHS